MSGIKNILMKKKTSRDMQYGQSSAAVQGMENILAKQEMQRVSKLSMDPQNSQANAAADDGALNNKHSLMNRPGLSISNLANQENEKPMLVNAMLPSKLKDDKAEFESILKNEQTDVKGNVETQVSSSGLFPTFGRINLIYTSIILINQILISFIIPFKLVFMTESESWEYVYYDLFVDFIFLIDMIIKFNMPIYEKGRYKTDRKAIAKQYIQSWFFLDLLCLIPISFIRKNSEDWPRGSNDLENLYTLNWNSLPRFYPMMMLPKLTIRMRSINTNMQKVLKRASWMPVQVQNILIVLYWLLFVINFCGGLLRSAANFNLKETDNWVSGDGLYDEPLSTQWVGAVYWSVVTVTTVGYGDITQSSGFELGWVLAIVVFGVGVFVTFLGELSTLFSELASSSQVNEERIRQVHELDEKFNIGPDLVDRLLVYFEQNVSMAGQSQQDMGYLFDVLPAPLKIQLTRFLNRDAIERVPFLKNRSDTFYLNYLEKFKPMRFDKDDIIFERGQKSREIFLNIQGEMFSVNTNRIFNVGHMIGQDDILFQRDRLHTFKARTELYTLRLEKDIFEKMLKEFPDIKAEILEESNLRSQYFKNQVQTHDSIKNKESKLVIRKFNEVAMEQNYDIQKQQRIAAIRRKEVQYRRSIEFVYKDKRLRNAIPPMESADGNVKRFVSANPRLVKILEKKEKRRQKQQSGTQETFDKSSSSLLIGTGDENNLVAKMYNQARAKKLREEQELLDQKNSHQLNGLGISTGTNQVNKENGGAAIGNGRAAENSENYISQARRRAIQVLMHQTVEQRTTKKYNRAGAPGNAAGASSLANTNDDLNPLQMKHAKSVPVVTHDHHRMATDRRFKEILAQQLKLLNFHRKQFEAVLSSEMDQSYLPEQVKILLTSGLQGIKHYLSMLESVNQRHQMLQKDVIPRQLQAFSARVDTCERDLNHAERNAQKLLNFIEGGSKQTNIINQSRQSSQRLHQQQLVQDSGVEAESRSLSNIYQRGLYYNEDRPAANELFQPAADGQHVIDHSQTLNANPTRRELDFFAGANDNHKLSQANNLVLGGASSGAAARVGAGSQARAKQSPSPADGDSLKQSIDNDEERQNEAQEVQNEAAAKEKRLEQLLQDIKRKNTLY